MTKDLMVEITKSSAGKSLLKVNSFKFCHEKISNEGLHVWRCVRSTCRAKFYTDDACNIVQRLNDLKSFQHNHVLSRTKLVKRLVLKEIKKVVALKGESIPTGELKRYAVDYLNQAFASTLKPNEMNSVKKAIHSYCRYYRSPSQDISSALDSPSSPPNKTKPITQNPNELRRLKICKAVEQQVMQYDEDMDEMEVPSSSESEPEDFEDGDTEDCQGEELNYTEEVKYPEPTTTYTSVEEQQIPFGQPEQKPYPNMTIIQPVYAEVKSDYPAAAYTVSRPQGWQPVALTVKEGLAQDSQGHQTILQPSFDPLQVDFAFQAPMVAQGVEMKISPPGSAFSFVGTIPAAGLIPRMQPLKPINNVIDLTQEEFNQRAFPYRENHDFDDEDHKFCLSLIPMFRRLSHSDKAMIKAQIHQLMTWKLKGTM